MIIRQQLRFVIASRKGPQTMGLKFGKFETAVPRLKEQVASATGFVSGGCFHITGDNHKVGNCEASDRNFLVVLVLRFLINCLVVEISSLVRLS